MFYSVTNTPLFIDAIPAVHHTSHEARTVAKHKFPCGHEFKGPVINYDSDILFIREWMDDLNYCFLAVAVQAPALISPVKRLAILRKFFQSLHAHRAMGYFLVLTLLQLMQLLIRHRSISYSKKRGATSTKLPLTTCFSFSSKPAPFSKSYCWLSVQVLVPLLSTIYMRWQLLSAWVISF